MHIYQQSIKYHFLFVCDSGIGVIGIRILLHPPNVSKVDRILIKLLSSPILIAGVLSMFTTEGYIRWAVIARSKY